MASMHLGSRHVGVIPKSWCRSTRLIGGDCDGGAFSVLSGSHLFCLAKAAFRRILFDFSILFSMDSK